MSQPGNYVNWEKSDHMPKQQSNVILGDAHLRWMTSLTFTSLATKRRWLALSNPPSQLVPLNWEVTCLVAGQQKSSSSRDASVLGHIGGGLMCTLERPVCFRCLDRGGISSVYQHFLNANSDVNPKRFSRWCDGSLRNVDE